MSNSQASHLSYFPVPPTRPPPPPPPKDGRCPAPGDGAGICVQECDHDDMCPGERKCCSNGCGTTCMDPLPEYPPLFALQLRTLAQKQGSHSAIHWITQMLLENGNHVLLSAFIPLIVEVLPG